MKYSIQPGLSIIFPHANPYYLSLSYLESDMKFQTQQSRFNERSKDILQKYQASLVTLRILCLMSA